MHTQTTRSLRRVTLAAGCGLAIALTGGCSSGGSSTSASSSSPADAASSPMLSDTGAPSSTPAEASSAPNSATPSDADAGAGPLINAGKTALGKVPGGTVTSIDAERGGTRWEVEVVTSNGVEHKVYVSRDGATVLSGPRTDDTDSEDRSENLREVRAAKLDYAAAAQAILAARGGTLTELNLDDHHGTIVWEADVQQSSTRYEVAIDAGSGDIVANHHSNDEED